MKPYDITIYPEKKLCVAIARVKTMTAEELIESSILAILDHEDWQPGYRQLFDHSIVETVTEMTYLKSITLAENITALEERIGRGRKAHICTSDMQYGLVRQWSLVRKIEDIVQAFRSVKEACAWLDIDNPSDVGLFSGD